MLNAEIHIQSIDYERTFEALFPMLMETVERMDEENMIIRLIRKLGETSRDVVTGILRKLPRACQDEILCRIVSHYRADVCREMNALLAANGFEGSIAVSDLGAQACDGEIQLTLYDVKLNYAELIKDERVQQGIGQAAQGSTMGKMVQFLSGSSGDSMSQQIAGGIQAISHKKGTGMMLNLFRGGIEKTALLHLEENYLPEELGSQVSELLQKKGIYAEVSAVKMCNEQRSETPQESESLLTKELEFAMVDAVADYLREREAFRQA